VVRSAGVYGLASDHAACVAVVGDRSHVISRVPRRRPDPPTSVHLPVLRRLSASVETVSRAPDRDSSRDANTQVCIGHWRPSRRISRLAVWADTGTLWSLSRRLYFLVLNLPDLMLIRFLISALCIYIVWLCSGKGIRPVQNWVVGCWHGYLSWARCRLAYGPADATATHCLLLQWNPDWFYLSGTGLPR